MVSFTELIQQGSAHAWLFFPSAILLGALHGLEPGHSKTMMAAFIIAIRGTIPQAILLGLSAAFSHSLLVWLIAAAGIYYGNQINPEESEPYFQLVSAVIIAGMAIWMFWRTRRDVHAAQHHHHSHDHDHSHHHHDHESDHDHSHHHDHDHEEMEAAGADFQDAHEKAHAADIEKRFAGRTVTTGQIVLFGITGGLMPCPAAVTVLLICLQLKQFTLGFGLVLAFSFGLALTMVTVGTLAAWSVHHAEKRFSSFGEFMRKAPYLSVVILLLLACYIGWQALRGLHLI
jgi:ABC-type nickel/cobalt efflux system permease component RcnA